MDARRDFRQEDSDRVSGAERHCETIEHDHSRHSRPKNTSRTKRASSRGWRRIFLALKGMLIGVMLGGMLWFFPGAWDWLDRPITKVRVGGAIQYLDLDRLKETLMPFVHKTFFSVNLGAMQEHLQQDSWIGSVDVRKIWPGIVEIVLAEQVPIARWQKTDMINADSEILRSWLGHDFSDMPALGGPEGLEQEVMQQYLTLSHQLRPQGLKVTKVILSRTGSWSFAVDGVRVELGGDELIERMQRFARLYTGSLKKQWSKVKSIDLRYRDGAAVEWIKSGDRVAGAGNG